MVEAIPIPVDRIEEARKSLAICTEAYERSKTYHNAVGIQQAKRELEAAVQESRSEFMVIEGDQGLHNLSSYEQLTSALQEIVDTISNPVNLGATKLSGSVLHIHNVAKQALIAIGKYGK
jgi:hypothetical protein